MRWIAVDCYPEDMKLGNLKPGSLAKFARSLFDKNQASLGLAINPYKQWDKFVDSKYTNPGLLGEDSKLVQRVPLNSPGTPDWFSPGAGKKARTQAAVNDLLYRMYSTFPPAGESVPGPFNPIDTYENYSLEEGSSGRRGSPLRRNLAPMTFSKPLEPR